MLSHSNKFICQLVFAKNYITSFSIKFDIALSTYHDSNKIESTLSLKAFTQVSHFLAIQFWKKRIFEKYQQIVNHS